MIILPGKVTSYFVSLFFDKPVHPVTPQCCFIICHMLGRGHVSFEWQKISAQRSVPGQQPAHTGSPRVPTTGQSAWDRHSGLLLDLFLFAFAFDVRYVEPWQQNPINQKTVGRLAGLFFFQTKSLKSLGESTSVMKSEHAYGMKFNCAC